MESPSIKAFKKEFRRRAKTKEYKAWVEHQLHCLTCGWSHGYFCKVGSALSLKSAKA